jgi:hypothetical protein
MFQFTDHTNRARASTRVLQKHGGPAGTDFEKISFKFSLFIYFVNKIPIPIAKLSVQHDPG